MNYFDENTQAQAGKQKDIDKSGCLFNADLWTSLQKKLINNNLMWKLDYKEIWALKYWCLWTVVLDKTLQSPLDSKEIKPVHPKETSPEYSLEGLMMKLKLHYIGHLMQKIDSLKETLMLWKIAIRRRGWQRMRQLDGIHQLNGYEFEQAPGVGEVQGSLVCCSPLGSQRVIHD